MPVRFPSARRRSPAFAQGEWQWLRQQLHLTNRESEMVELLLEGLPNKLIARELGCGIDNVKKTLGRVYLKAHVSGRMDIPHTLIEVLRQRPTEKAWPSRRS